MRRDFYEECSSLSYIFMFLAGATCPWKFLSIWFLMIAIAVMTYGYLRDWRAVFRDVPPDRFTAFRLALFACALISWGCILAFWIAFAPEFMAGLRDFWKDL